jgi:Prokaryotic N-terminal methylation motif
MTGRNPRAGVTLLETLIGLLVMSMVAALLSAAFGTNIRLLNRTAISAELVDQALARRDLRIWIEHALESPVPNDPRPIILGSPTELKILAVPPTGPFWPGVATEVSIGPSAVANGLGVQADRVTQARVSLGLAPDDTTLQFAYWGRSTPDSPPGWHSTWTSDQGLPDLIKLTLVGSGNLPAPIVIRPAKAWRQSEMSLSSLVPPALPSRP